MSQYYPNNATVADIYKSVISDVINQVKEAFLDENVDDDVLQQLRKDWEDKVNTSGCVELEPRNMIPQHQMPPAQMRQGPPMQPRQMQIPVARMPSGSQQMMHPGHQIGVPMDQGQARQVPVPMHYMQQGIPQIQGQHVQAVSIGQNIQALNVGPGNVQAVFPQGVRVVTMPGGQQNFMSNQQPMMIMQNANGQPMQQLPFTLPPNVQMGQIRVQQPHMQQHHQLDGNGNREFDEEEEPQADHDQPGSSTRRKREKQPSRAEAEKVLAKLLATIQLDGGGGGMSDSSSEEEEEENDPLRRIADKIGGDGAVDEGDNIVEEDPLNSDDDDQDDEELDTIFDADHIIMCLFEKVHRARNKWKFQLKDGIMNINNRDYCFQKCTGDAEW